MQRLTQSTATPFRLRTLAEQGGLCAVCGQKVDAKDAVLDHDHVTGECRGVLHRGCNSMLGKIENHRRIAKLMTAEDLARFLRGVVQYLYKVSSPSRIGTPEEISVPSVRVNRATAILRIRMRRSSCWQNCLATTPCALNLH